MRTIHQSNYGRLYQERYIPAKLGLQPQPDFEEDKNANGSNQTKNGTTKKLDYTYPNCTIKSKLHLTDLIKDQTLIKKLKNALLIIFLVIIATLVDLFFKHLSIPVTTMDLLFIPFCVALLGIGVHALIKRRLSKEIDRQIDISLRRLLYSFIFAIIIIMTGIYLLIEGLNNPFKVFSSVKAGPTHGYTLVLLAIVCISYSVYFIFIYTSAFIKKVENFKKND